MLSTRELQKSISLNALQKAVQLRIRECIQGMGGLETLSRFFQQIVDIPEMAKLRLTISTELLSFQKARNITDRTVIRHKSYEERTAEVMKLLGLQSYRSIVHMFKDRRRVVSPEVIAMWWAYGRYKRAFMASYEALGLTFNYIAKRTGWDSFRIDNIRFLDYLELSRVEAVKGESRISIEEKNLLQFLVYGNLAAKDSEGKDIVSPQLANYILDRGVNVLKYGYITEVLDPSFLADYSQAEANFIPWYHEVMRVIQPQVNVMLQFGFRPHLNVQPKDGSYWFPFLKAPEESWETGTIAGEVELSPFPNFPLTPKPDEGIHVVICSPSGKGKTVLESSIISHMVTTKNYIILQPIYDDSNQLQYSVMPLFPYDSRTEQLHTFLKDQLFIEPKPIPCMTLNVVTLNELDLLEGQPLTIYDRLVLIDDHETFRVDFNVLIRELKKIALSMGYPQVCGVIGVRDLHRYDPRANVNLDLKVCTTIISPNNFDIWREHHRNIPMMFMMDEIAERAPSHYQQAGGDQAAVSAALTSAYRRFRRKNVSAVVASQRVREFIGEVRDASGSVLFRELSKAQQKEASQVDQLLDMLYLEDPSVTELVKGYIQKGTLSRPGTWFWWWWHKATRRIRLLWSIPPCFCLEDPFLNPRVLFEKYEKLTGKRLLVDDINKVPVLLDRHQTATTFDARYKRVLSTSQKQRIPLGVGKI